MALFIFLFFLVFWLCLSYNLKLISHYFAVEAVDMPFLICRRHDGCWRKHKLFMQMSGCTPTCNVNSCTPDWPYFITSVSRSACLQLGTFVLMPPCMPHTHRHTWRHTDTQTHTRNIFLSALWRRESGVFNLFFFFFISVIMCKCRSQTVYSAQAWRDVLPWQTCETESVGWSCRR